MIAKGAWRHYGPPVIKQRPQTNEQDVRKEKVRVLGKAIKNSPVAFTNKLIKAIEEV